jgi:hypothetical protein
MVRPYVGVDFMLFFPMAKIEVALDENGNLSREQTATV